MLDRRALVLAAALLLGVAPASADDEAVIGRWDSALLVADRTELPDLLADNARIRLGDLGIEQSKQEFIASMDEWQGAVSGAAIRHRIEKTAGGTVTVIACYDFPSNEMLMQETFAIAGGHISASSQSTIAESCEAF